MSRRHVRWVEDAGRGSVTDDVGHDGPYLSVNGVYLDPPDARELAEDRAEYQAREQARIDAHNAAAEAAWRLNHPPARCTAHWGCDNTEETS